MGNSGGLGVAVLDFDFARQAVEFEEDGTHTGSIGFGDVVQLDKASLDGTSVLFPRSLSYLGVG